MQSSPKLFTHLVSIGLQPLKVSEMFVIVFGGIVANEMKVLLMNEQRLSKILKKKNAVLFLQSVCGQRLSVRDAVLC